MRGDGRRGGRADAVGEAEHARPGRRRRATTTAVCPRSSRLATTPRRPAGSGVGAEQVRRAADLDQAPGRPRAVTPAAGRGGELAGVRRGQPGARGRRRPRRGPAGARWGAPPPRPAPAPRLGRSPAPGRTWISVSRGRALGQGAGLVERDQGRAAELLHHDGGLDQHAVPAGVGDRGQQRRHGGQHHRARRGDDHEGHRAQQRRAGTPRRRAAGPRTAAGSRRPCRAE